MIFLKFTVFFVLLFAVKMMLHFSPLHTLCLEHASTLSSHSELYKALICGERLPMHSPWYQVAQKIGILHIFVISGMHLIFLEALLQLAIKNTSLRLLILLLFTLTSQLQPPVVRAWTQIFVQRVAQQHKLQWNPEFIIGVTGVLLLMIFPDWIQKLSFHLSWYAALLLSHFSKQNSFALQVKTYFYLLPLLQWIAIPSPLSILANTFITPLFCFLTLPFTVITFSFPSLLQWTRGYWELWLFLLRQLATYGSTYSPHTPLPLPPWLVVFSLQFLFFKKSQKPQPTQSKKNL